MKNKYLSALVSSSLSIVPPVKPKPRPEILATDKPKLEIIGKAIKLTLSPIPPVECLSMISLP